MGRFDNCRIEEVKREEITSRRRVDGVEREFFGDMQYPEAFDPNFHIPASDSLKAFLEECRIVPKGPRYYEIIVEWLKMAANFIEGPWWQHFSMKPVETREESRVNLMEYTVPGARSPEMDFYVKFLCPEVMELKELRYLDSQQVARVDVQDTHVFGVVEDVLRDGKMPFIYGEERTIFVMSPDTRLPSNFSEIRRQIREKGLLPSTVSDELLRFKPLYDIFTMADFIYVPPLVDRSVSGEIVPDMFASALVVPGGDGPVSGKKKKKNNNNTTNHNNNTTNNGNRKSRTYKRRTNLPSWDSPIEDTYSGLEESGSPKLSAYQALRKDVAGVEVPLNEHYTAPLLPMIEMDRKIPIMKRIRDEQVDFLRSVDQKLLAYLDDKRDLQIYGSYKILELAKLLKVLGVFDDRRVSSYVAKELGITMNVVYCSGVFGLNNRRDALVSRRSH